MSDSINAVTVFVTPNERYFSSENHVKNLEKVEISCIADMTERHSICDIRILLGYHCLYIDDLDEILIAEADCVQFYGVFTFPFLKELSYAEIVTQALNALNSVDKREFLYELRDLVAWEDGIDSDVIDSKSTLYTFSDDSALTITVDEKDDILTIVNSGD